MNSLNDRIARLRQTRVSLRAAIKQAWADPDPGYRQQRVQTATMALRSTEDDWRALMAEQEARADRVELAPTAAPVRRSVPSLGYLTKVLVPGR